MAIVSKTFHFSVKKRVSLVLGTDLHIPGKATEVTAAAAAAAAAAASAAPSAVRPRVCSVCSAACTLASSTAPHSLAGVNGWLEERERESERERERERETFVYNK